MKETKQEDGSWKQKRIFESYREKKFQMATDIFEAVKALVYILCLKTVPLTHVSWNKFKIGCNLNLTLFPNF